MFPLWLSSIVEKSFSTAIRVNGSWENALNETHILGHLLQIARMRFQLLKGNTKCILKQKNNSELPKSKLLKQTTWDGEMVERPIRHLLTVSAFVG